MKAPPSQTFAEIGARLRAHRIGRGLSPEALADRLGISRAALYRAEKGEIAKIEMLNAIAGELDVSLPTLLGVGVEYVPTATGFFERMRQIEAEAEQIIGLFSPVSYLLTSEEYDAVLAEVLRESASHGPEADAAGAAIGPLLAILRQRKETFRRRRPLIASIISSVDLERFLLAGLAGRNDLDAAAVAARRRRALAETRHIAALMRDQAIGVQIGLAQEPIPSTSFQIVRRQGRAVLTISPFRLGQQPNIRIGVGLITAAPEALALHEGIAERLWTGALKGAEAAAEVERLIARFGIGREKSQN